MFYWVARDTRVKVLIIYEIYIILFYKLKNKLFLFEVSKLLLFTLATLATFDYQVVKNYSTLAKLAGFTLKLNFLPSQSNFRQVVSLKLSFAASLNPEMIHISAPEFLAMSKFLSRIVQ